MLYRPSPFREDEYYVYNARPSTESSLLKSNNQTLGDVSTAHSSGLVRGGQRLPAKKPEAAIKDNATVYTTTSSRTSRQEASPSSYYYCADWLAEEDTGEPRNALATVLKNVQQSLSSSSVVSSFDLSPPTPRPHSEGNNRHSCSFSVSSFAKSAPADFAKPDSRRSNKLPADNRLPPLRPIQNIYYNVTHNNYISVSNLGQAHKKAPAYHRGTVQSTCDESDFQCNYSSTASVPVNPQAPVEGWTRVVTRAKNKDTKPGSTAASSTLAASTISNKSFFTGTEAFFSPSPSRPDTPPPSPNSRHHYPRRKRGRLATVRCPRAADWSICLGSSYWHQVFCCDYHDNYY